MDSVRGGGLSTAALFLILDAGVLFAQVRTLAVFVQAIMAELAVPARGSCGLPVASPRFILPWPMHIFPAVPHR